MSERARFLAIHGHFYQPPRENPWLGSIDVQESARPWHDWNARIAAECYLPMAAAKCDTGPGMPPFVNNYADISFNFGPTLNAWMQTACPEVLDSLAAAASANPPSALAQAYGHAILPLADARDRHCQIVWGIAEFRRRFGFSPAGMWLPECAVDRNTVRALIDHGIGYVILSPHQASQIRPFGESHWRDASMGVVDTTRSYRIFETDGAGRTHFDRWLDVVFYTPGLNLKISFDHILNRPPDLARELDACWRDECRPQLASIVTDGEIYGHHEKNGQDALARLIHDIAPGLGIRVTTVGEFLRDYPPSWEVRLWDGEDGLGSSWSCRHGVGRWFRDCGCRPPCPDGWNQEWRRPLRLTFDHLRTRVRNAARRGLDNLIVDVQDAMHDYINVVFDPSPETRNAFLTRHARRILTPEERGRVWRLLEALRNAMLMYVSCGWFFDELSGIEPVQNMRYALRAAELADPCGGDRLIALLEQGLSGATSNVVRIGNGGEIFRRLVLPDRCSDREIAAATALHLSRGVPTDWLPWRILSVSSVNNPPVGLAGGVFTVHDPVLDREMAFTWLEKVNCSNDTAFMIRTLVDRSCQHEMPPNSGVEWLGDASAWIGGLSGMPPGELSRLMEVEGVRISRLPAMARNFLHHELLEESRQDITTATALLGEKALAFVIESKRRGVEPPPMFTALAGAALKNQLDNVIFGILRDGFPTGRVETATELVRRSAESGVSLDTCAASHAMATVFLELLGWLDRSAVMEWLAGLSTLIAPGGERLTPTTTSTRLYACSMPEPGNMGVELALGLIRADALRRAEIDGESGVRSEIVTVLRRLTAFGVESGLWFPDGYTMDRRFWLFLNDTLTRSLQTNPTGLMSGGFEEGLLDVGELLGLERDAIQARLLETVTSCLERSS